MYRASAMDFTLIIPNSITNILECSADFDSLLKSYHGTAFTRCLAIDSSRLFSTGTAAATALCAVAVVDTKEMTHVLVPQRLARQSVATGQQSFDAIFIFIVLANCIFFRTIWYT